MEPGKSMQECRSKFDRRKLCIFTRFPAPGTTKTRLIPSLGAEAAANLQRAIFRKANLSGADLRGTKGQPNLENANLEGVRQ